MNRTWLITGCSTGFGRELALEALGLGDSVAVTARKAQAVADIADQFPGRALALPLDVTARDQVIAAVEATMEAFGRIDVLVNNAGYALMGGVEEVLEEEYRAIFETNFYGAVRMIQAVLPHMRRRRSGHIVNISSMGGISGGLGMGYYGATKFALTAISESLAQEASHLGIKVTVVEPGAHRTKILTGISEAKVKIDDYADTVGKHRESMNAMAGFESGDPRLAAQAIIRVVESESPPVHLPLGEDALARHSRKVSEMIRETALWRDTILSTSGST